jgi:hypothetical protein
MTSEHPIEKDSKADDGTRPSGPKSSQADTPVAPTAREAQAQVTPNRQTNTEQTSKEWREKIKLGLELTGLIVLIIYTVFSGCQAYYSRKTANDQREALETTRTQFQQDQRPYVAVTNYAIGSIQGRKPHHGPPVANQPVFISVHFKNLGKTDARDTFVHRHLLFDSDTLKFRIEPPDKNRSSTTSEPNIEKITTTVSVRDTFANESAIVSSSDLVAWNGSDHIIVFGRISYQDRNGVLYCAPYAAAYLGANEFLNLGTLFGHNVKELCPEGIP